MPKDIHNYCLKMISINKIIDIKLEGVHVTYRNKALFLL